MNQIQNISFSEHGVQITFIPEGGLDPDTGIATISTIEIPHEVIPTPMLEDLHEACEELIDHARVVRRKPADEFKAPR